MLCRCEVLTQPLFEAPVCKEAASDHDAALPAIQQPLLLGFLGVLQGYRLPGLVIALGLLGLGYGIRYGSSVCLYMAMAICAGLSTGRGNYAASSTGCDVPNLASILVFVYVH